MHQSPRKSGMKTWGSQTVRVPQSLKGPVVGGRAQKLAPLTASRHADAQTMLFHSTDVVRIICKCSGHRTANKTGAVPAPLAFTV